MPGALVGSETDVLRCDGHIEHNDHWLTYEQKASTKIMPCVSRYRALPCATDRGNAMSLDFNDETFAAITVQSAKAIKRFPSVPRRQLHVFGEQEPYVPAGGLGTEHMFDVDEHYVAEMRDRAQVWLKILCAANRCRIWSWRMIS